MEVPQWDKIRVCEWEHCLSEKFPALSGKAERALTANKGRRRRSFSPRNRIRWINTSNVGGGAAASAERIPTTWMTGGKAVELRSGAGKQTL